jgi:hypothetical protein
MKHFYTLLFVFFAHWSLSQGYWQQEVNYKINVTLDDKNYMLNGDEEFEYINNSDSTLNVLFIHLWPNGYKNKITALSKQLASMGNYFLFYAKRKDIGYIDSLDFTVNGAKVEMTYYQGFEDIAVLKLNEPIAPGGKAVVKTPFRVKLPSGSISRMGHVGESFQITQWYPKPAVFDKEGWKPIPYLTQGEFYSEFGSFDVSITLPKNYIVGSTGDLQTQSEIDWLNELAKKPLPEQLTNDFPASSAEMKTIRYKQSKVHDFGWFADKRWIVRKGEKQMPHTGRTVATWAMFTPENAKMWEKGTEFIGDALYTYSYWTGDYPYNHCTAVDGTISAGGGMEYPNVTVIGNSSSEFQLATVIIHEVGHNWFYGIFGSNERENGWMDEGINSFMETLTLETKYGDPKLYIGIVEEKIGTKLGLDKFPLNYQNEIMYDLTARVGEDQPIQTHSAAFSGMNYGAVMYKKTGLAFNYLKSYLGDDLFRKCMMNYWDAWSFKHPTPTDIRAVFESTTGKDLSWFFEGVIKTDGVIDYKAQRVMNKDGKVVLSVFNAGDINAPYSVSTIDETGQIKTQWFEGFEGGTWSKVELPYAKQGDMLKLNLEKGSLDIDRGNNNIRTTGIFKTREPLSLDFLTGIDDPEKTRLFWMPAVAWNDQDRWMFGATLHNRTIPLRKLEFSVTPMYSFSSGQVVGLGTVRVNARSTSFGVNFKRFTETKERFLEDLGAGWFLAQVESRYLQLNPFIEKKLKSQNATFGWNSKIRLDGFYINQQKIGYFDNNIYTESYGGGRLEFTATKKFLGGSFTIQPSVDVLQDLENDVSIGTLGLARLKANANWVYDKRLNKKIYGRLFVAHVLNDDSYLPIAASGTRPNVDYFYNNLFLGRGTQSGILANQFINDQGGLILPYYMSYASTSKGFGSLQVEIDMPVKLPLSIYTGAGLYNYESSNLSAGSYNIFGKDIQGMYAVTGGVGIPIVRNYFQIYVPLFYTDTFSNKLEKDNFGFKDRIMFELNLDMMNPFNFLRQF